MTPAGCTSGPHYRPLICGRASIVWFGALSLYYCTPLPLTPAGNNSNKHSFCRLRRRRSGLGLHFVYLIL